MPYNLLLLPLLGGFLFLHLTYYFRFVAQRLDGYRLLLYSAIAGTLLGILGRIVVMAFADTKLANWAAQWWIPFAPFQFSETSAWALALGPFSALVVNRFIDADRAKDIEVKRHGNSIMKLLHRAERDDLPVSLTLSSLKWYVGFVAESPNLSPEEKYFRILPIMSGYRDRTTLETLRRTSYEKVLADPTVNHSDLVITLPLDDVKIASLFDDSVYDEYFAPADKRDVFEEAAPD
ncbi:MAG: hypothetical protein JOZ62_08925 [Acidobacteriaceae bacterium]|nr:hypothetical protein [Acidobacteriaceae bacterium]